MKSQENSFLVSTKEGVVTNISNSYIMQPALMFGNGSIKWYEDKITTQNTKEKESLIS